MKQPATDGPTFTPEDGVTCECWAFVAIMALTIVGAAVVWRHADRWERRLDDLDEPSIPWEAHANPMTVAELDELRRAFNRHGVPIEGAFLDPYREPDDAP